MALPVTPIAQLFPTDEPCKIQVRIARLWGYEKQDRPGVLTGLDMILVDEKGSRIQASVSMGLIKKYHKELQEGACRSIMNFRLLPNQGTFRGTSHPYKITFTFQSVVKKTDEIPNLCHRFFFHPFEEILSDSHDPTVFFDVIGEIIGMSELEDVRVAERIEKTLRLQLRDHGNNIIDCTLWSKFAIEAHTYFTTKNEGPAVLIGSLMKTRVYNGKTTVQTNPFASKLFFSLDLDEIKTFGEGLGGQGAIISLSQTTGSSFSGESGLDSFPISNYQTISQILGEAEDKVSVTIATIVSLYSKEAWWYIGCNSCFRKATPYFNAEIEAIERDKYSCGPCDKEITNTSIRFMVKLRATDETGSAAFLLFDREAATLIQKNAYDLRQEHIEYNREGSYPQEFLDLEGMSALLKVKIKASDQGFRNTSYQVLKISVDQSQIQSFSLELTKATPPTPPAALSLSSVPPTLKDVEVEKTASETGDHEGFTEPFTPAQKRPLDVVVVDPAADSSSTKRSTPQSVNKPKGVAKVFVKKERK